MYFAREAAKIAPCYFVAGNHEARSAEYAELKKGLLDAGIIILDDNSLKIEKDGQHIVLHGINDPLIKTANATGDSKTITKKRLAGLNFKTSDFTHINHFLYKILM